MTYEPGPLPPLPEPSFSVFVGKDGELGITGPGVPDVKMAQGDPVWNREAVREAQRLAAAQEVARVTAGMAVAWQMRFAPIDGQWTRWMGAIGAAEASKKTEIECERWKIERAGFSVEIRALGVIATPSAESARCRCEVCAKFSDDEHARLHAAFVAGMRAIDAARDAKGPT